MLHKSCLQDSGCGKTCKRRSAWSCDVNYIKKLCVFPQTIKYICSQFIQYLSLTFRKVVFMEIHHSFVNSVKYPDFQTSLKKNQIKDSALCTTCRKTSQLDLNNSRYNYWTVWILYFAITFVKESLALHQLMVSNLCLETIGSWLSLQR